MSVALPTADEVRAVVREELERALDGAAARREWMTIQELAAEVKKSRNTVGKWVREGQIPSVTLPDGTVRLHYPTVCAALLQRNLKVRRSA